MELPPSPPPVRSKRRHNFPLPNLWGERRLLRCVKPPPSSHSHHRSPPLPSSSSSPSPSPDHAAARSVAIANEKLRGGAKNGDAVAAHRPWNLRTRRAACSVPGDEATVGNLIGVKIDGDFNMDKNEKLKFSVSLLKEEIEEDFTTLIGKKPPRRPKKRPRMVQKDLKPIFPGLSLAEQITTESYNVPEAREK